ncbi:MAG TPA: PadR family transcriptional regulator [Thermoplasmata archaeon]|nr:PadR family transcriptional regulator [Thermoplasmata archaeon]
MGGSNRFLAHLRREVRRGFLPWWVIERLAEGPAYGYELMERIGRELGPEFRVTPSTLYPTLARLRAAGLVRTFHGKVSAGPLRKYYELTDLGRESLPAMRAIWAQTARVPSVVSAVPSRPKGTES